jgi:hypothetical protein
MSSDCVHGFLWLFDPREGTMIGCRVSGEAIKWNDEAAPDVKIREGVISGTIYQGSAGELTPEC